MLNTIELLLEQTEDQPSKQHLQVLLTCLQQLSEQIQQILKYLKIEAMPFDTQYGIFNLDKLMKQ